MPDVANAQLFMKMLTEAEQRYLKQIEGYRRQARGALLEITDRQGVTRPAVTAMQREIEQLTTSVTSAGRDVSKEIRRIVQNYTRKQVQLANKAGLTAQTDIGSVIAAGAGNALDGEQSFMTSTPAWLTQLQARIEAASAQLRISQAAPDEVNARLLSESLADGRASVWASAGNTAALEEVRDVWTYGVGLLGAYLFHFNESEPEVTYQKQAIATIDDRTTECCLEVHGQIQPIEEPFQLSGTPRFADEIQDPPFHYYCRSSETLYHPDFEEVGVTTEQMETMAHLELDARELTGRRSTINPSHATSRRREALPSG